MDKTILIIAIIIMLIIILIFSKVYFNKMNSVQSSLPIENLTQIEPFGYADLSDPYERPFVIQNFIMPFYCQTIMDACKDRLADSEVIGGKHPDIRNSKQCWISKHDPIAKPLFEKICNLYNIPFENAEDLQVVRYLPGQYFNEHHDSCCDAVDKCREFIARGGQRKLTVLIYLNNEFEGGNTYFRNLDLKLKPKPGDAIVFYPLAKNSSLCHPLALHAGMPVTSGIKWIANMWFREKEFKYA